MKKSHINNQKENFSICMKKLCKFYGIRISTSKITNIIKYDNRNLNISNLEKNLGFSIKEVKGNDIKKIISSLPLPAIASINENNITNYIVIKKIRQKEIIIYHPQKKTIKYSIFDFNKIWNGLIFTIIPTVDFKSKEKGLFKKFWCILKYQKKLILKIFFISILITTFGIAGSFYFKFLVDKIIPNNLTNLLTQLTLAVILLFTFKTLFEMFRTQLLIYLGQNIDITLMLGYYEHVIDLPMNFFDKREAGDIIARFNDTGKIRDAICSSALTIMIDALMAIIGGFILYKQNTILFLITIIPIILYGIIVYFFRKPFENINRKTMESGSKLTSFLISSLNGIETIKTFNAENEAKLQTEKKFLTLVKNAFNRGWINNLQNTLKVYIKVIFNISIFWIGSIQVLKGNLSLGQLLTFNALLAYFITPIENIINLQPSVEAAIVASERVGEILDTEKEKNKHKGTLKPSLNGDIQFNKIYFQYNPHAFILKNINLNIKYHQKIAFVGESGSGKTTLAKLLMHFYPITSGEILINNENINDIDINYLRNKISYVSQNLFFFNGSIKENLRMGNFSIKDSQIINICKKVQIHNFINSLPNKYDTIIEENGSNLSGGQKQRLSIARALLKNPEIIIFDEATSNLDSVTERLIEITLSKYTNHKTTIIIAHRLRTIVSCDKIYVLNKGKIVENGTHKELINKKGYYYNLWNEQLIESIKKPSASF